jgi:hypothetical protein
MGIGKNSDMEGKIPTWWEKFGHGGKNFDMVGKIPPWKWNMVGKSPHSRKNSDMVGKKDREGYMKA